METLKMIGSALFVVTLFIGAVVYIAETQTSSVPPESVRMEEGIGAGIEERGAVAEDVSCVEHRNALGARNGEFTCSVEWSRPGGPVQTETVDGNLDDLQEAH